MPGGGADQPTLNLNKFIEMASETGAEEFELDLQTGLLKEFEEWEKTILEALEIFKHEKN